MEYSVVIPVYNEQDSLSELTERLVAVIGKISKEYEIIYVDDASNDDSLAVINNLKQKVSQLKVVSFTSNQGQSAALKAGFNEACGEWIITLDADLQNPPEEIKTLVTYKNEADFITGIRQNRQDTAMRKIASKVAWLARRVFLGDKTKDTGCSLRMFKREILLSFPFFKNFHRFFALIAQTYGVTIKQVPVRHMKREFGISKYTNAKRAAEGVADLIGVLWLKHRIIEYKIKDES